MFLKKFKYFLFIFLLCIAKDSKSLTGLSGETLIAVDIDDSNNIMYVAVKDLKVNDYILSFDLKEKKSFRDKIDQIKIETPELPKDGAVNIIYDKDGITGNLKVGFDTAVNSFKDPKKNQVTSKLIKAGHLNYEQGNNLCSMNLNRSIEKYFPFLKVIELEKIYVFDWDSKERPKFYTPITKNNCYFVTKDNILMSFELVPEPEGPKFRFFYAINLAKLKKRNLKLV